MPDMLDAVRQIGLPAYEIAGEVNEALAGFSCLIVTAPPGAGKSTVLPLTILDEHCKEGRIIMIEPRRIAARQIAERMSAIVGEPVGKTVGYRVRFESRVSRETRVEVVTEGIFTRMMVDDPTLDGVSVVIFDEFHERSVTSDESLALVRESQRLIRPDLKIVIMSATIDVDGMGKALDAFVVRCGGRCFPVEVKHSDEIKDFNNAAQAVADIVRRAHRDHDGDILAFLPGEADIRRCRDLLDGGALGDTAVCPLYGMLPFDEQRRAIAPSLPGERKVVLATPIAETSLTIEGIRIVVDSGLYRKMVFDPRNGLSHLETMRVSMDMAVQRTGRAGRVAPGVCYRLWSEATEARMLPCRTPEIQEADLAPLVLDMAAWGTSDISRMPWLTPPDQLKLDMASSMLNLLGALDESGRITPAGRRISGLPCHPRIAGMMLSASGEQQKALAADIAALLEEKDPMSQQVNDSDICIRLDELRRLRRSGRKHGALGRILMIAEQYRRMVNAAPDDEGVDPFAAGALLAAAYPERIAKARKDGCGRFLLAGGNMAEVGDGDVLSSYDWIVAAVLNDNKGKCGRIFLGAPVDPRDLSALTRERDLVCWDSRQGGIVARHELNIGCLNVSSHPLHDVPKEVITDAICRAAAKEGLSMFDFTEEVGNLQRRVAAVASWHPELEIPDLSTDRVLSDALSWLPIYAGNALSANELKKIDMCRVMWGMLSYAQQNAIDRLAPSHIEVPTGSRIKVEYRLGADAPVLRVRLQECFGMKDTPRVDGGRVPVLMELLSPGFKPVQLTSDLASFWDGTYFEVRKELRRRYPKHSWPDDPLEAPAVRGVARRNGTK